MTAIRDLFLTVTGRNFGYTNVDEATISALPQTYFTPYGNSGPVAKSTTGTGAHIESGIVDGYSVVALAKDDARLGQYAQVISQAVESMPTNWRNASGQIPNFSEMNNLGDAYGTYGTLTRNPDNTGYGWNLDLQHQCHYHFIAFLDAYRNSNTARMDELILRMKGLVVDSFLKMANARFGAKNIYNPGGSICDIRGAAWAFMSLGWCLCAVQMRGLTNDYNKAELIYSVEQNAAFFAQTYITGEPLWDNTEAAPYQNYPSGQFQNSLGFIGTLNPYGDDALAIIGGFQFSFMAQCLQTLYGMAKRGFLPISATGTNNLRKIAVHASKMIVALGGPMNTPGAIDFRRGMHNYTLPCGTGTGGNGGTIAAFFTSYSQISDVWENANGGPLPANESPPVIRYHDTNNDAGPIGDGYLANYMPALAGAVDLQSEGENVGDAMASWARLESSSQWINTRTTTSLQWAYTPRGRYIDAAPGSTSAPTSAPSPTTAPAPGPSAAPTPAPTPAPTTSATSAPSSAPTSGPTSAPTSAPTGQATSAPIARVFAVMRSSSGSGYFDTASHFATPVSTSPTSAPTNSPTPTSAPTNSPSPTSTPTGGPTSTPTTGPTSAPSGPIEVNPVPNTQLRSQYGTPFILTGANAMDGLSTSAIAYVGRIVNANNELDFAIQIYAPLIPALGLKVLSVYVGAGPDAQHMPEGLDIGNLVKIGEVGMIGGGWSALLSIAKTLNLMPPVVDIYVRNDAGRPLASTGHQAIALPTSARWIAA